MKKVLIIAYSFPPVENAESARSAIFVSQLHKYGWEPLVLTRSVKAQSAAETGFEVPEGVDVIRSEPWEPGNLPRYLRAAGKALSSLLVPDTERLWELFCLRKAVRLARNENADLVYTVSPPSSAHLIGLRLKRKYPGMPWVADMCSQFPAGNKKIKERYHNKLMNRILNGADSIITGSREIYENLKADPAGPLFEESFCWIPDGHVQELSEQFEKACRVIAARKIKTNNE